MQATVPYYRTSQIMMARKSNITQDATAEKEHEKSREPSKR